MGAAWSSRSICVVTVEKECWTWSTFILSCKTFLMRKGRSKAMARLWCLIHSFPFCPIFRADILASGDAACVGYTKCVNQEGCLMPVWWSLASHLAPSLMIVFLPHTSRKWLGLERARIAKWRWSWGRLIVLKVFAFPIFWSFLL